jgi:quercetin dioxygenase-like cupin family protein
VLGYVIEGELRFQIAGQPERTVRAGDSFWEPPGALHLIAESAQPGRPVRFLAIIIADAGKPLVEPA